MADLSPKDRLVRKRNSNLQKQLDVTLQILGEEYRQTKERMYKEERDCGKFLQSLYNTVPGLTTYGQPDTRAMNSNSMLKERRYSMTVSVLSGSDREDLHNPLDLPFRPKARTPAATNPAAAVEHSRPKSSKHDDRGIKFGTREASGRQAGSAEGGSKQTVSGRDSPAKRLGENSMFPNRPRTAGNLRNAPNPMPDGSPEKPSLACFSQDSPRYGRSAYSEHERFVQDRVLKRFDVIFDPATEARKVSLSTIATPIVMVQPDDEDSTNNEDRTTASARIPHSHVSTIKVNGEEFHMTRNPTAHRRVVWSARPHRGQQAESAAPNSAKTERPKSETPATARPRMKSTALTARTARNKSLTVSTAPGRHPSGRQDSHVHLLSLQKSLPAKSSGHETLSECSSESDMDEQKPSTVKLKQEMHKEPKAQAKPAARFKKQPFARQKEQANAKSPCIAQENLNHHAAQQSRQPEPNQRTCGSSNLLEVPGTYQHPLQIQNGASPGPEARRNSAAQGPSSRLSDASDRTPPVELWSKLMKAGLSAAGRANNKRPKTAPSKSELSHRSMPAPRQTVVGILAQIENQKANTRNMINASKDLQKVVKKLVPWEQQHDLDDW